ncbi:MAG: DUF2723 domain-containing protein [Anaerolineales bacterium]|nr:DUF2723 domain-containing protein [Anaerolineales bacterium]
MNKIAADKAKSGRHNLTNRYLFWVLLPAVIAFILYASTAQYHINGSNHPFATDVGEIQNALPRWGTIHHSGYPLYTALGSFFVTLLNWIGIPPAAGASLFSAVLGSISIGLLAWLMLEIGMSGVAAAVGALATAVTTSIWVDASIAEVHTMTTALSISTLIFALRFGRDGDKRDLYLLTLFFTQAVAHQRSVILLAPAVLLLIWPHVGDIFQRIIPLILITLLAPLTYLYLPLRVWMGADWVFGTPGTWDGFWTLFFDNRAGRVFEVGVGLAGWLARTQTTLNILADDLFWPLLLIGLGALLLMLFDQDKNKRRIGLALTIVWVINFILTVLIWRDRVVDAQLAAKLPVLLMAGIGLGVLIDWLRQRSQKLATAVTILLLLILGMWAWQARAFTLTITRDRSVEPIIETVDRLKPFADGRITTVSMPWGRDFWGLTYAQAYHGQLQGLNLVDHNANPRKLLARGDHLLAPLPTFVVFPLDWWQEQLNSPLYLATAVPDVVEISTDQIVTAVDIPATVNLDLENGIHLRYATAERLNNNQILVTVYWEATGPINEDYSAAVHLVTQDPPLSPTDILDQADNNHPVEGLYPTSSWRAGEIVRDHYLLTIPINSHPAAIRIGMYRSDPDTGFINSPWYSLNVTAVP